MGDSQSKHRPTSIDVARLAGVSQTTVSLIIRDVAHANISAATRARVMRAIEQLDYEPHEAARSLRSRSTHILGMAIPEAYNTHLLEIASAAETYAKHHGYGLFLAFTDFDSAKEQACLQWLKQQRYDALLLISRNKSILSKDLHALQAKGYPIVALGFDDPDVDSVSVETTQGEEQLLQHLVTLGHRKIGYIYGVADQTLFGGRLDSCLAIQQRLGIPIVESYIRRCGPNIEDGYATTRALLADIPATERPTALITINDLLASAAFKALYEAGISVPTAMSVASFDNTPLSPFMMPPLTTVDCEARLIGENAARLAIERLQSPNRPPESVKTKATLVVRDSTGPVPHGNA